MNETRKNNIRNKLITGTVLTALLLGLPLLGVGLLGKPLETYMEFPPKTQYVEHAEFSWLIFAGLALAICCVCFPFEFRVLRWRKSVNAAPPPVRPFPWWGWLGIFFGIAAWIIAWSRFEWMSSFQKHTFTPLWFAYIVVVNALTYRRTGHCMLKDRAGYLLALFGASAAFWWFFEYLNRFVQNWYYIGTGEFTPLEYFFYATLPFSTVLPAVMGTYELLRSNPRIGAGLDHFIRVDVGYSSEVAIITLAASSMGLLGIGVWPDFLFPLLWVSPLLIIASLQALQKQETIFAGAKHGKWREMYLFAMSALICGFFWEMWNHYSLAKWIYTVPFVGKFKAFEMPILGFVGYLPFGLECAVIAEMIWGERNEELTTDGRG